ncbi:MAG: DnaJ domain-containing protein [Nitrospirota bacterium]|nr:DnaJ domain-containing protein [Nitrospirota bacterium]
MEIPLKGNINSISLVKILVQLNRNGKTGTLNLSTPSFTKTIYLNAGDVIFASSNYADDRLGEMLLKAGTITVEQYDKSVEILTSTGKRQGAILVELGCLTPKELFRGLKYQVNEIIQSMFMLEDAEYEFREGDIPSQEVISLKMSMGNLIYAGVNKIVNWTRIRNVMPDTGSVLKLSEDPLSLFQEIELSSQDKKILSLIDGKKTIKEIIDSSWMGSFEALKILYVLWSIGMIEEAAGQKETLDAEETAALEEILRPLSEEEETMLAKINSLYFSLGNLTMHELLEVDETSDSEKVKKNYYRLAKEYHPDRHLTFTGPDTKKKLTTIFDAITKAYSTLRDETLRTEYFQSLVAPKAESAPQESVRAEDQFKKGIAEFKTGNFWGAIDHFKWAIKLNPEQTGYLSYLSLAYSKVPGKLKEAEEALHQAIKLEPFNADLHANLGLIYMKAGLKKRAHTSFQKALKIDPHHDKARKGLEQTKA